MRFRVDSLSLCLSANRDIIGRSNSSDGEIEFSIYNVRGEVMKGVQYLYGEYSNHIGSIVHVDCLMAVPSNIKQKKRKNGPQNHKEVKQGKGITELGVNSGTTWELDCVVNKV
ncbi:hypothetical protein HN873_014362 [Arachis hypogaea]